MEHTHTEFVAASPERVYDALADVANLPRYVPQLTAAERLDGDRIRVHARYDGHSQEGEAWFRADAQQQTIEWGAPGSEYRGRIHIGAQDGGSLLTFTLMTSRGDAPEGDVMGTLDAIRRLVEADV